MTQFITLPDDISDAVQNALARLIAEVGEELSFEKLKGYIERWRGKDMRIEEDTMSPGMTGYAIALRDCDLIATRRGLTKTQKKITQLHEMAHFLKGDIPLLSRGEKTGSYENFIKKKDRHTLVVSRQRFFDSYNNKIEKDAELLARILAQAINNATWSNKVLSDLLGG